METRQILEDLRTFYNSRPPLQGALAGARVGGMAGFSLAVLGSFVDISLPLMRDYSSISLALLPTLLGSFIGYFDGVRTDAQANANGRYLITSFFDNPGTGFARGSMLGMMFSGVFNYFQEPSSSAGMGIMFVSAF